MPSKKSAARLST